MGTLKEEALQYEPRQSKTVADLEKVPVNALTAIGQGESKEGKPYQYMYISFNDEEYRVPFSVLDQLKAHLAVNAKIEYVKVTRKGQGMDTKYTVTPLN